MKHHELYSIEDARFPLGGIARKTIYVLLIDGELASVVIGRPRFIPAPTITVFIATSTTHIGRFAGDVPEAVRAPRRRLRSLSPQRALARAATPRSCSDVSAAAAPYAAQPDCFSPVSH
jgi:hypothetical protein